MLNETNFVELLICIKDSTKYFILKISNARFKSNFLCGIEKACSYLSDRLKSLRRKVIALGKLAFLLISSE